MGMTHVKCIVFNLINPSQQTEIEFLVDSGAIYTVIPAVSLQSLNITPHSERIFTLADGRQITWPVGNAGFTIGSRQGASVVVFGPGDTPSLLGVATLEELGLGIDPVRRELTQIPLPLFSAAPYILNTT
jgi:clan AA aspartic protease